MTSIEAQEEIEKGSILFHPDLGEKIFVVNMVRLMQKTTAIGSALNIQADVLSIDGANKNPLTAMQMFDVELFDVLTEGWEIAEELGNKFAKLITGSIPPTLGSIVPFNN